MSRSNQSGSAMVIAIIVAVVVIAGGATAYFMTKDSDDNNKTVTTTDTDVTAGDTTKQNNQAPAEPESLPDGYPADAAPIYKPSKITLATSMGDGWMVYAETNDDIEDVAKNIMAEYGAMSDKITQSAIGEQEEGVGQVAGGNAGYGIIITYSVDDDKSGVVGISYHVDPQRKL